MKNYNICTKLVLLIINFRDEIKIDILDLFFNINKYLQVSVPVLERSLNTYLTSSCQTQFDLNAVPLEDSKSSEDITPSQGGNTLGAKVSRDGMLISGQGGPIVKPPSRQQAFSDQLKSVPQLAHLADSIIKSSQPIELTESETEYVVTCIKHCLPKQMLLQFDCTNTLNDQLLEQVYVQLELPEEFHQAATVSIPKLACTETGSAYALIDFVENYVANSTINATLKFLVKDCDPTTGLPDTTHGYDDEYMVNPRSYYPIHIFTFYLF